MASATRALVIYIVRAATVVCSLQDNTSLIEKPKNDNAFAFINNHCLVLNITVAVVYHNDDLAVGQATLSIAETQLRSNGIIPEWITFNYCFANKHTGDPGTTVDLYESCFPSVILGPPNEKGNQDKSKCVEFWRNRNVLHAVRTCPVGKPMSLSFSETIDRYRCTSNSCKTDLRCKKKTYGLTKGTWLEQSNLSLRDATLIIYTWAHEQSSIKNCARELEISRTTVINWNMYLREVCASSLLNSPVLIGGPGHTVEIDESVFSRRKYNVGRLFPEQWVFGGICRETKECFLYAVPDRSAATLMHLILQSIRPRWASLTIYGAAMHWNIPVLGYGQQTGSTSPDVYKTFVGTALSSDYSLAILNLLMHFGWQRFGIMNTRSNAYCGTLYSQILVHIQEALNNPMVMNISITLRLQYADSEFNSAELSAVTLTKLKLMQQSARVFVICPGSHITSSQNLLRTLYQRNMTNADYVYVLPYFNKAGINSDLPWVSDPPDPIDDEVLTVFKSSNILVIDAEPNATQAEVAYRKKIQTRLSQPPSNRAINATVKTSDDERFLHDAFYTYGVGLNRTLSAPNASAKDMSNGFKMATAMANVTFYGGATGTLRTGADRNRIMVYSVLSFDSGNYSNMATIELLAPDNFGWTPARIDFLRKPHFHTHNGGPPLDVPMCGFMDELCYDLSSPMSWVIRQSCPQNKVSGSAVAQCIGCAYIALFGFSSCCSCPHSNCNHDYCWTTGRYCMDQYPVLSGNLVKRLRKQQQLIRKRTMAWKLTSDDVKPISYGKGKVLLSQLKAVINDDLTSEIGSINHSVGDVSRRITRATYENPCSAAPFVGIGICRGFQVSRKQIVRFRGNVKLSSKDVLALYMLRETRHENLNRFVGLILPDDELEQAILIWSYCRRGSLEVIIRKDVLFNDAAELDVILKSSLIGDLAKGLAFIHGSSIGCHGSLKTFNCVVDSLWVLKLSDFGLQNILPNIQYSCGPVRPEDLIGQGPLHLAPEQLRSLIETGRYFSTKEGDMYSFGMIIYQIWYIEPLFGGIDIAPTDLLRQISGISGAGPSLRPNITRPNSGDSFSSILQDLMNMCWRQTSADRPTATVALEKVLSTTKKRSANIIDHVIATMEQYTETLERLVDERSMILQGEKERADNLLRQLLPQTIVDRLKQGNAVAPEFYDSVTICVLDIVQFTKLSSVSTPLEIVSMLNLLYTNLDYLCKQRDVYKLETIGDAYVVASGLPQRNGTRHAVEVADLTLHMTKFVESEFYIPHKPGERLQLRTGIHTGPVAAGIVGLTTPRFCVFGSTVNTASEMESTSEPQQIHISERSASLLKDPRYILNSRGSRNTMSAGIMETFWLQQKEAHEEATESSAIVT